MTRLGEWRRRNSGFHGGLPHLFYVLWKHGRLGLLNVESDLDVVWASQVYKFLTSKDPKEVMMCVRWLRDTMATRRAVKDASFEVILDFLNSHPDEGEHRKSTARAMMSGCCLAWCEAAFIVWGHCCAMWRGRRLTSDCRSEISRSSGLRVGKVPHCCEATITRRNWMLWRWLLTRGRAFVLCQKHPSSSKWIGNGKYMSFADYWFAIKGRLNQLPVQTVLKRTNRLRGYIHCWNCKSQPETLAHALNHCRDFMSIRSQHGEILKRTRKAIPSDLEEIFLEQEIQRRDAPT